MSVVYANKYKQRYGPDSHGPSPISHWDIDVEAEAADVTATYLTVESEVPISGYVAWVEIQPYTTLAQNTVISVYHSDSYLTTPTYCVYVTQAAANAAISGAPTILWDDNTLATPATTAYTRYPVCGYLTLKLSTNFIAGNRVRVRIYVDSKNA